MTTPSKSNEALLLQAIDEGAKLEAQLVIMSALKRNHGKVAAAAREIGMPVRSLWRYIKRYSIDLKAFRCRA